MVSPQSGSRRWLTLAAATLAYALSAAILTWPLTANLTTTLLGDPAGDTGVYVWNLWIFGHELLDHGRLPFSTDHILAFTGGADFSLHNYMPLAGLVGTVLTPWLGVVGAFNVLMLVLLTLSGVGVFLLGRQIGLRRVSAWIAGVMFMAAPLVTARQTAHISLIGSAPLPLFLWALLRTLDRPGLRGGAVVGVMVAMATYSDVYYGIYCVLMSTCVLAWRFLRIERTRWPAARWPATLTTASRAVHAIDVLCLLVAGVVVWRIVSGTTAFFIGPIRVGTETLYTPMLVLVALAMLRASLWWRPRLRLVDPERRLRALLRPGVLAVAVCVALLSPLLVGLANRYAQGRWPDGETYWRSSPRGVDLLAYMVPNANHAWFGPWTQRWLLPDVGDAFPEFVAGFSLFALAVIAVAAWRRVLPAMWVAFTAVFVLLSLGPFIVVGGVNTFVVGPWALLRYVPLIGMARSPARFSIVAAIGLSLLFAFALEAWLARGRTRWRLSAAVLATLIALEVISAPRTLYSAAVPDVYRMLAAVDDEGERGRLLELPAGIRDGTSSVGDFSPSTQFFQTSHGRPLIGGYLSRVSGRHKRESLQTPMLRAIFELSERTGPLPDHLRNAARRSREAFLARSCVRFVLVDKRRASPDLRAFALDVLGLALIHEDDRYELLVPVQPPTCDPPPPGRARRRFGVVSAGRR